VVLLIWLAGTNILGMVIALGVVLAASAVFVWRKNRSEMRGVLRDLRPPKKS